MTNFSHFFHNGFTIFLQFCTTCLQLCHIFSQFFIFKTSSKFLFLFFYFHFCNLTGFCCSVVLLLYCGVIVLCYLRLPFRGQESKSQRGQSLSLFTNLIRGQIPFSSREAVNSTQQSHHNTTAAPRSSRNQSDYKSRK